MAFRGTMLLDRIGTIEVILSDGRDKKWRHEASKEEEEIKNAVKRYFC